MAVPANAFMNPAIVTVPPPLPPGWTEHIAPGGQTYYYNGTTKQSTYVRPLPTFLNFSAANSAPELAAKKKKKEKPLVKTPIPSTEWIRVKTTEGNVFYTHKEKKQSVWTVPDEIKDAVELLDRQEAEEEARRMEEEEKLRIAREREEEIERVKREVEDIVGKRKAEEPEPVDELIITKKARVEEEEEEGDDGEDDEEGEESDEEWQKEAAAQLAAEAEEEALRRREEEEQIKKQEEEERKAKEKQSGIPSIQMPSRVDLSLDEAKALFKTLLREKDINPLLPWDTTLPLFISDPRYVLLPSVAARRDAFDEYCRERARELRQAKVQAEASGSVAKSSDPKEEFDRLLREEVKSTRTVWGEWRRLWKKDRRFYGWGRDDREREKRFKDWLKELGEQKRAAAKKAEADFFALLKEKGNIRKDSVWKEVKAHLHKDPRYDPVGSSSLREELFNTYVKTLSDEAAQFLATVPVPEGGLEPEKEDRHESELDKKERAERAVREREEKVRAERSRVENQMARSRVGLDMEEGERDFKSLLVDAIRDPQATWSSSVSSLKIDPRFSRSPLTPGQQIILFNAHISQLRAKHINSLYGLFETHAPSLATPFEDLPLKSLLSSLPAVKLGFSPDANTDEDGDSRSRRSSKHGEDALRREYEKWQRERTTKARVAFDEMLAENSFVEFWGRLNKIGGEGVDGGVKADEGENEDEGEGGGGKADLKALAKQIDIREMERVLKNDKRYVMFDHVPEQRERWLRDHIAHLTAPKLSVHVPS